MTRSSSYLQESDVTKRGGPSLNVSAIDQGENRITHVRLAAPPLVHNELHHSSEVAAIRRHERTANDPRPLPGYSQATLPILQLGRRSQRQLDPQEMAR